MGSSDELCSRRGEHCHLGWVSHASSLGDTPRTQARRHEREGPTPTLAEGVARWRIAAIPSALVAAPAPCPWWSPVRPAKRRPQNLAGVGRIGLHLQLLDPECVPQAPLVGAAKMGFSL